MTIDRLKLLRQHKRKWRPWRFDDKKLTLSLRLMLENVKIGSKYHEEYWVSASVDLTGLTSSAEVLDWVADIARAPWAYKAPEIVGKLVIALNDLLQLQEHYCADGVETFSEHRFGYETPRDVVRHTLRRWESKAAPWIAYSPDRGVR